MIQDQYYSIEEVANLLKVAYLTVYRWVQSGKIISYKAGKQHRILHKDMKAFLKKTKYGKTI